MSEPSVDRTLGEHDGRIGAVEQRTERIENKVDSILEILHTARGGWKALVAVGTLASTLASAATALLLKLIGWLNPRP